VAVLATPILTKRHEVVQIDWRALFYLRADKNTEFLEHPEGVIKDEI
jgi:hypothetical protein